MGDVVIEHSGTPRSEAINLQLLTSENGADVVQNFHGAYSPEDELREQNSTCPEAFERGYLEYGCSHYRRRCRIRAPCCNEIFDCRHCHNEAKNSINIDHKLRHEIPRHKVERVICSLCSTEQEVCQVCIDCGVCMGRYFCGTCKLFDDDISKRQYHCDGCGICRIGGKENFFHCSKCRCCYSVLLKNSHPCVEGAMHHDCPVCFEYLFESVNDVTVMRCGHTIHKNCLKEMQEHYQYACPLCSKSLCDMSKVWEKFDMEIAATPMPESYQDKKVSLSLLLQLVRVWELEKVMEMDEHCRFGSFVMIVEPPPRCNFILWPRNVHVANLTIPAKQEADRALEVIGLLKSAYRRDDGSWNERVFQYDPACST